MKPKDRTEKCGYCGKERHVSEMAQKTVLWHPKQKHMEHPRWYCKADNCANHHQWSLEG